MTDGAYLFTAYRYPENLRTRQTYVCRGSGRWQQASVLNLLRTCKCVSIYTCGVPTFLPKLHAHAHVGAAIKFFLNEFTWRHSRDYGKLAIHPRWIEPPFSSTSYRRVAVRPGRGRLTA